MLLGSALTVGRITVNAVAFGSIAGSAYGMGRKYGRVICEKLDEIEGRITASLSSSISE
jgi:hypothetical protein